MQVEVTVRGADQAQRTVDRLSRRLADGTPAIRGLVDTLLDAEEARFRGYGARWRKLSRRTIQLDRAQNRDPRPMVLTGKLMRSLTRKGDANQIVRVTPTSLTFGTSVYYAKFHQKGQGVPRRTIVGLTRIQRQHVVAELRDLLMEGL